MHQQMAGTLDLVLDDIRQIIPRRGHVHNSSRPRWPMIVLETPKGWTGPKIVDGQQVEGTFRAHQVPLSDPKHNPNHLMQLESWLQQLPSRRTLRQDGKLLPELAELAPTGVGEWVPIREPMAGFC